MINGMYVSCRVLYAKWHNLYVKIKCEMMAFNRKIWQMTENGPIWRGKTDRVKHFQKGIKNRACRIGCICTM
jgi:hypothetical protein